MKYARGPRWTGSFPVLLFFVALAGLMMPHVGGAQELSRTWLPWRTIETARFAFHYPAELEAWTREVAARMESIDSAVTRMVGYTPPHKVNIVVDDPYGEANGSAWPFLDTPAIIFWATPPNPHDGIGDFNDWETVLSVHEFTHIAHLTRPSRNPGVALIAKLLPVHVGPLAINAPRWVDEGYATYIEGKATGSGRPNSAWRPAVLRQWALEGRMPPYDDLDATGGFQTGNFAYLAGSAFLEWLAQREGDSSLVKLWRRMSARQDRDFDEAFAGVFGDSPAYLYGRFTADLTGKALQVQRELNASPSDTGVMIEHLGQTTGDPAISPDGSRVALVVRSAVLPPRTVIWSTAATPDTALARASAELLKSDPEDVPAKRFYPPPRRTLASLVGVGNLAYEGPRFLRDGRVLVWRSTAQGDGSYRPDLYLWNPLHGAVTRVTHDASVRDADPAPDGATAIADRCAGGHCDLVRVDLVTGAVTLVLAGAASESFYRPRFSPDGQHVVTAVHYGGHWRLATLPLATARMALVGPDDGANRYDATFIDSTTLVAVSDRTGIAQLERIDITAGVARQLTRVTGEAIAPERDPVDHTIWFLSLHTRGYDVRRLDPPTSATATNPAPISPALFPAAREHMGDTLLFGFGPLSPPRDYGLGPRKWLWIPGAVGGADGLSGVLALANTDVVGRAELLLQGTDGAAANWRGASATATWRGSRPFASLSAFSVAEDPSRSGTGLIRSDSLNARLDGAVLSFDMDRRLETNYEQLVLGASTSELDGSGGGWRNRSIAFANGTLGATDFGLGVRRSLFVRGSATVGRTEIDEVTRILGTLGFDQSGSQAIGVSARLSLGHVSSRDPFERFTLGGSPATIVDPDVLSQRVAVAALPAGIDGGTTLATYRVAVPFAGLTPYIWGGRTSDPGRSASWHRLLGIEWSDAIATVPTIGTPAARGTIGVGRSLDAPYAHQTRAYIALVFGDW